eukprot:scaffold179955_cov14-Tisochrysis_lutea.AAC.1
MGCIFEDTERQTTEGPRRMCPPPHNAQLKGTKTCSLSAPMRIFFKPKHTKAHTSHPQASPSEISPSSFPFFLFPKLPDPGYLSFSTIFLTICMKPWPLASWIQTEFKGASKIAPA